VKELYIAATGQNRGKTTLSVGLIDALLRRGLRVGFIKPVGQRYAHIEGKLIDEDAVLIDSIYRCGAELEDMSPIAIEKGFTQSYIAGQTDSAEKLLSKVRRAIERVREGKDVVVVEGTGHAESARYSTSAIPPSRPPWGCAPSSSPAEELASHRRDRAQSRPLSRTWRGGGRRHHQPGRRSELREGRLAGAERPTQAGIDVLGVMPFVPLLSCLTMELIVESVTVN